MTTLRRLLLALLILAATSSGAAAQATIFLVRHAERNDGGGMGMAVDPPLSAAGRARATALAAMLKDAKLTAVFATEFKRTQETARPAAQAHHLTVTTIKSDQTAALVEKLRAVTGAVLVVGHSNSVPEVIAGLGITTPFTIPDTEFDNLFIVMTGGDAPRITRLRYK
jgi:phosphohistidine phosphatase SixA